MSGEVQLPRSLCLRSPEPNIPLFPLPLSPTIVFRFRLFWRSFLRRRRSSFLFRLPPVDSVNVVQMRTHMSRSNTGVAFRAEFLPITLSPSWVIFLREFRFRRSQLACLRRAVGRPFFRGRGSRFLLRFGGGFLRRLLAHMLPPIP